MLSANGVNAVLWAIWAAYWFAAAWAVKAVEREVGWQARLAFNAPIWLAALLLLGRLPLGPLDQRFVPASPAIAIAGTVIVAVGLGLAIWARVHLGSEWSATVTVKRDHALIRSGPYGYVRHPIYAGLLLALAGTALSLGQWRGLLAFAVVLASVWYKLRLEERLMEEVFGADYRAYRTEVPALVPFIR